MIDIKSQTKTEQLHDWTFVGMAESEKDGPREKELLPKSQTVTVSRILVENEAADDSPKKRRRTAKPNPEKKFECKHEGCGKSYSRAEHLYRHQLNHTPKTIYRCDYPDCNRYFVRQDLCVRHRERHTTHGSQLHKRDSFAQASATQAATDSSDGSRKESDTTVMISPSHNASNSVFDTPDEIGAVQAAVHRSRYTGNAISPLSADTPYQPPASQNGFSRPSLPIQRRASMAATGSMGASPNSPDQSMGGTPSWHQPVRRESYTQNDGRSASYYAPNNANNRRNGGNSQTVPPSPVRTFSDSSAATTTHVRGFKQQSDGYINGDKESPFLPSTDMNSNTYTAATYHSSSVQHNPADLFADTQRWNQSGADNFQYANINNTMQTMDWSTAYGYPIFGGDDFNRSPFALADEFAAWLFNDNQSGSTGFSPANIMPPQGESSMAHFPGTTFFSQSPNSNMNHLSNGFLNSPMNLTNLVGNPAVTNYIISEEKRQELLDIMQTQFIERPHDAVKRRKEAVFEGNPDADGHVLSLRMMHTYISSYWYHQHAQLPILHKPTFLADKTENLLLLAIIAIGAATLDKAYGTVLTKAAADFANFVVWHLRWEIIRDEDYRPPAKLWVFQTLLLIEVYEKMYATRALHERAHIHHDSTLTLMRRGSSLIGRSANDTPPNGIDGDVRKPSDAAHAAEFSKSEENWNRWITAEATRRVAFAAFVLDSIHCTMFGHSAKMVAHELRLPLPCDEGLWSAMSPAEVGRVQSSLQTNGIKPTMFLDGLKKTLNGQRVRTNSFGRTIIMAGLLSVSWHMAQRDVQISALGPRASSFAGRDNWKGVLLRAFDNWKRDFDEALAEATPSSPTRFLTNSSGSTVARSIDEENIFESRTVLHHLAHIAAHADIIDCQVFAGANRLLSRSVTPKDYSIIRDKIERWATKASARDAAFYALKFIAQVLIPPDQFDSDGNTIDGRIYGHASPILPQAFDQNQYIARDDFLLNRPWILYISSLVVWSYGYALEGPIVPTPRDEDFETYEQKERDMRAFLDRVASVRAPDDLEGIQGKNRCMGLLLILKESFISTRWELTHEAAVLLGNAIAKLKGQVEPDGTNGRAYSRAMQGSISTNGGQTDVVADMR